MPPPETNANGVSSNGASEAQDEKAMPFQGQQPYGMANDLVIPGIMDIANTDERLWVSISRCWIHTVKG